MRSIISLLRKAASFFNKLVTAIEYVTKGLECFNKAYIALGA